MCFWNSVYSNPKFKKKTFPIRKIPFLVRNLVIRNLTIPERIQLSILSKFMETCVQEAHTKETKINLCLNGESSYIHCFGEGVRIFCGSQLIESPNVEIVTSLDIAPWLNPKLSAVQNTIEVCRRVRKILNPCSYFGISLTLNNLDSLDIPRILAIPHLMPRRRIMVIGSEIDKAQLDLIMEEGPEVRDVLLDVKKIPDNYHHKNAFKFSSFICTDSRWVQIESLLSFRNRMVVALNNNPFTIVDINRLIKQWINGDCDMFAHLVLNYTGPRETGLMDVLFDGLVTLELHRGGTLFYLFAIAKPCPLRKFKILSLWCTDKLFIKFSAIPINTKYTHFQVPKRIGKAEYNILKMLNSKKKLRDEIVEKRESNPRDPSIWEMEEKIQVIDITLIRKGVNLNSKIPILRKF